MQNFIKLTTSLAVSLTMLTSLFSSVSAGTVEDVRSDLEALSKSLNFAPAFDDNVYCHTPSRFYPPIATPNGNFIANIADANNIIIFIHGFNPMSNKGTHDLQGLARVWQHHMDIASENANTSYCVVTWDTDYGHDDPQQTLAKLLKVVFTAASDKRIANSRKPSVTPNIVLVGHSAGGNYIKYSLVKYNEERIHLGNYSRKNLSRTYNLSVLTMATPHLGTSASNDVLMYAFIGKMFTTIFDIKGFDGVTGFAAAKALTRGAQMLSPEASNPPLRALNQAFRRYYKDGFIIALAGINDKYVSESSATPTFTSGFRVSASHDDFLFPDKNPALRRELKKLYGGQL